MDKSGETLEQIFRVPTPARLLLSNIRGSVEIETGNDGELAVRAVKHVNTGDALHTEVHMTQSEDGSVAIETLFKEGLSWFLPRKPCRVDYFVRVPRQCSAKVSGVSNTSSLTGLEGEIAISTVSGPLNLHDLSGSLKIHSVSGNTRGERLNGALVLETVSGDLHLVECDLSMIQGSSVSGNIQLEGPLGDGPYRFNSVSGQVHWRLPETSACAVEVDSLSGRLRSDLPVTYSHSTRRHGPGGKEIAEINGGGVCIAFHSISGNLYLEARPGEGNDVAPWQPELTVESQPALSRMEILQRIEAGEMSVEDGTVHLRKTIQ